MKMLRYFRQDLKLPIENLEIRKERHRVKGQDFKFFKKRTLTTQLFRILYCIVFSTNLCCYSKCGNLHSITMIHILKSEQSSVL